MAVTIKDVSAKCGLSISTVSKAFNNYADISLETRELVQRTAREIGYYPKPSPARSKPTAPTTWAFCSRKSAARV